jgi:hypothetical protein
MCISKKPSGYSDGTIAPPSGGLFVCGSRINLQRERSG